MTAITKDMLLQYVKTHAAEIYCGRIQSHHYCQVQGQDAVEHFARHGLDAAPKLVHCVQAPPSSQTAAGSSTQAAADADRQQEAQAQHVYDLRLVQRSQLPARYFTISATGIVEVGTAAVMPMLGSCQQLSPLSSRAG